MWFLCGVVALRDSSLRVAGAELAPQLPSSLLLEGSLGDLTQPGGALTPTGEADGLRLCRSPLLSAVLVGGLLLFPPLFLTWGTRAVPPMLEKVVWGSAYCLASIVMTFANKYAVRGTPVFLAAAQMLFGAVFLLSVWPALQITRANVATLAYWLPVSTFFVTMIVSSLYGFQAESISTCVMMGSVRPLYALAIETTIMGVRPPSRVLQGCALLLVGTAAYTIALNHSLAISLAGFLYLVLNGFTASIDRCYQRFYLHHRPLNATKGALVLTMNLAGLCLLVLMPSVWRHEVPQVLLRVQNWRTDPSDFNVVLLSCIGGVAIGFAGVMFQQTVSAVVFLAVATGVRAFLFAVDTYMHGLPPQALFGLVIVMWGSVLCVSTPAGKESASSLPEPIESAQTASAQTAGTPAEGAQTAATPAEG